MSELDLYGPPGTGKTTALTKIALQAVEVVGPQRLGAVTYTRAAATELKGRLAAALGIQVPENPQAARRVLESNIPYVGTVHSLAWRLIGRPPLVSTGDLKQFAGALDPSKPHALTAPNDPDTVEGYEFTDVAARDEIELALQLHAMARHRLLTDIREAASFLGDRARMELNLDRLGYIAQRYEGFKTDIGKIDFEDMLMLGADVDLPVSVLLCDEVQDNSALLWRCIDAWASRGVEMTVMAGDPWQAIYLYSGAEPRLFRGRKGDWRTIGNSYRLDARTATFALDLLRAAGYENDSLLSTWKGVGGSGADGTTFFLARTNNLLAAVKEGLEDRGEPYNLLRGTGPLQTKACQAYRAYLKEEPEPTMGTAALVASALPEKQGILPHGLASTWLRLSGDNSHMILSTEDRQYLQRAVEQLPHYRYFDRIYAKHGMSGLVLKPTTSVGTIHAAKGREADSVYLLRSWGFLPGRRIYDGGRQEEACVAYVGATRHRSKLVLVPGQPGIDYPFGAWV